MRYYFTVYPKSSGKYAFASQSQTTASTVCVDHAVKEIKDLIGYQQGSCRILSSAASTLNRSEDVRVIRNDARGTIQCRWQMRSPISSKFELNDCIQSIKAILKMNSVNGSTLISVDDNSDAVSSICVLFSI